MHVIKFLLTLFFCYEKKSNWELGVVLPIYEETDIPAPYLRPPPRYQSNQDAWTQNMEW